MVREEAPGISSSWLAQKGSGRGPGEGPEEGRRGEEEGIKWCLNFCVERAAQYRECSVVNYINSNSLNVDLDYIIEWLISWWKFACNCHHFHFLLRYFKKFLLRAPGSLSQLGVCLCSGCDLGVLGSSPVSGSPPSRESTSPSPWAPAHVLTRCLSGKWIGKIVFKKSKIFIL